MEMKHIAPAFVKAKRSFGPALKDKNNPAFRSKYADLGACIDAVEDALSSNGIVAYHETFEDMTGVTVETVFLHESGESLRFGKLHVPAAKQDPQGYGSALTYARRYSLMAACGIAPEDDDGNAASRKPTEPVRKANGILEGPGAIPATVGAMDRLEDEEERAYIIRIAASAPLVAEQNGVAELVNRLERSLEGADQWIAFWSCLGGNSKLRSAIKREQEVRRMAAAPKNQALAAGLPQ